MHVPVEDRDSLRFLLWPGGEFCKGLQEYRITVHLFGVVSSHKCVNFALCQNAEDCKHEFPPEVISTIVKNFYVDDCLRSLPSTDVAIKHVYHLRKLMRRGGFNLTKWVSNDRLVLESLLIEDGGKGVKELNLSNDILLMERALGVSWLMETDTFGCKVSVKDRPCTRRGILQGPVVRKPINLIQD